MARVGWTDASVRALKCTLNNRQERFDSNPELPGFACRVTSDGIRSFGLYYRIAGSMRLRRIGLGRYPHVSLADAREAARDALRMAAHGVDPAVHREKRQANTFEAIVKEFCTEYLEHGGRREHAASYIRSTKRMFERHVVPRWRDRPIDTIGCSQRELQTGWRSDCSESGTRGNP
jgi:hypothetical protein